MCPSKINVQKVLYKYACKYFKYEIKYCYTAYNRDPIRTAQRPTCCASPSPLSFFLQADFRSQSPHLLSSSLRLLTSGPLSPHPRISFPSFIRASCRSVTTLTSLLFAYSLPVRLLWLCLLNIPTLRPSDLYPDPPQTRVTPNERWPS